MTYGEIIFNLTREIKRVNVKYDSEALYLLANCYELTGVNSTLRPYLESCFDTETECHSIDVDYVYENIIKGVEVRHSTRSNIPSHLEREYYACLINVPI